MWLRTFSLLGLSSLLLLQNAPPLLARPQSSPESQGGTGQTTAGSTGLGTRTPEGACAKPSSAASDASSPIAEPDDTSSPPSPVLKPIIPDDGIIRTQVGQPLNLYVYIPPETNRPASLTVGDLTTHSDYSFEATFDLTAADTIARLVLPPDVAPLLAIDNKPHYTWKLTVYCPTSEGDEYFVIAGGEIVRLDPSETPPVWYEDTLDAWFAERENDPKAWQRGLRSIGFGDYAQYPVQTYRLDVNLDADLDTNLDANLGQAESALEPTSELTDREPTHPEPTVSPAGAAES
ncbi:MAG: DUF928 domain-containing protein [Cyanobacteria bacterium P01_G01_bin.54]